jgi:hypothetical protein
MECVSPVPHNLKESKYLYLPTEKKSTQSMKNYDISAKGIIHYLAKAQETFLATVPLHALRLRSIMVGAVFSPGTWHSLGSYNY